ncbi:PAX-interacting protein 1 isoform X1 [Hydra vulgaris]|uniref:PAX-interacting protein 1 isoform X1 n=1 Tax=Hydra vulgaris TaxID=6087 RepID=UPI001F5F4E0A|nr:PAX-interacting protein 1 isoform X1 [Hydra vulgaris]
MNKSNIFKGVKYFFTADKEELKQCLKDGGAMREFYISDLVTHVISDSCDFPQLHQVVESKIPIVTTNWVHMSVKCGTMLPTKPFSPMGDGLFQNMVFCPSQIPVKDREILLAMIVYHGGVYKINLTKDCTHLVVGQPYGRKYDFALKHAQLKIVTVEWIVDCSKEERLLPEEEYAPIPSLQYSRSSVVLDGNRECLEKVDDNSEKAVPEKLLEGCVIFFSGYEDRLQPLVYQVWKDVIRKACGEIEETYSDKVTHFICLHQQVPFFKKALADKKKIATAYWLNDILVAKTFFPPNTPLHLPSPFTEVIADIQNSLITVSGYNGHERLLVKHMINFLGAHYTGHMTRSHTHLICKTPAGEKFKKAVEWQIPVISASWLGDMLQTGQSFPTNAKSKYTALGLSDELLINQTFSSHITDAWSKDYQEEKTQNLNQPEEKIRKLETSSGVKRVLFTGLTGNIVYRLRQNVQKMNGELAHGVNDCTHLVAPKITRTVKFLSAVSICKFLVAPAWVDDSFEAQKFLDEAPYTLVDPESEELFGFKLKRSLQRAQTRQVCKGLHFHVTPSILPAPNAMREIIECAGGKMSEINTLKDIHTIFVANCLQDRTHNSYLVSCMDDKEFWSELSNNGYDVYNVELILSGVMKQELEWNLHHL